MAAFLLGFLLFFGLRYWQKEQARDPLIKRLKSGNMEIIRQAAIEMNEVRDVRRLQSIAEDIRIIYRLHEKTDWGETRNHIWTIIQRLQHLIYRQGCLCKVYPLDKYSDPEVEDKKIEISILKVENYSDRSKYWLCRCRSCGEKYMVVNGFWDVGGWLWRSLSNEQFEAIDKIQLNVEDMTDLYGYGRIDDVIAKHRQ